MKGLTKFTLFIVVFCLIQTIALGQQALVKTIEHDGLTRSYRIYIPSVYNGSTAVPLLFNLHGYTSNAQQQENYGNFRPIADTANFILVHPDGTLDASNNMHWDAFSVSGVDDIGFISRLIDTLAQNYSIDLNRVYSAGMSNGGYMSYELACSLGDKITAVGSVTGSMPINRPASCNPLKPTPIIQIHGTNDMTVPYNGNATSTSIPALVDYWVDQNNCDETPIFTAIPDSDPTDLSTVEHYYYPNGDKQSAVSLFKVINGGHTWPGAPFNIGVTNKDINASVEIWKFFQQFDNETLLTTSETTKENVPTIYPNPSTGQLNISADELMEKVKIFDCTGKKIMEVNPNQFNYTLQLEEKGLFFVHVHSNQKVSTQKVLVF